jgi:FG-GAP-like repeat/FG-GAP repeat
VHYYGGASGATDQGWTWLSTGDNAGWRVVAAADFNGDGIPDLVWQNDATRQVTVHYYVRSFSGYSEFSWSWLNAGNNAGWRVAAAADFNGDGVPDLVWQNDATRQVTVHYYGGASGASDQGWNWLNTGINTGWRVMAAADFNGDGVPDLVWQNEATRQVTVNYYAGSGGAVYQGWNWLFASAPGWSLVNSATLPN